MHRSLLLILFFLFVIKASGQDSTRSKNCDSLIKVIYGTRHTNYLIGKNVVRWRVVERKLQLFPSSNYELKKHKKFSSIFLISTGVSLTAFYVSEKIFYANHNKLNNVSSTLLWGGIGGLVFSFTMGRTSSSHLKSSIKKYNEEICSQK